MASRNQLLAALALGLAGTALSSLVNTKVAVVHPDIMGCEQSCLVVAAGWPVPYIQDYPAISPVGSADLSGALFGLDHINWKALAVTFAIWLVVAAGIVWLRGRLHVRSVA